MYSNLSTFDNFSILLELNRNKELRKKTKPQGLFFLNIVNVFIFFGILLFNIIYYYTITKKASSDDFSKNSKVFLLIKLTILFVFYLFNTFLIGTLLHKKLDLLKEENIEYLNSKGYYLIYCYLNNTKINRINFLNRIFNTTIWIYYLSMEVMAFSSAKLYADNIRIANTFAIIFLVKLFVNFVSALWIYIYFWFYGTLFVLFNYLTIYFSVNIMSFVSLIYATLFTLPFFYFAKVVALLVLYRKEQSKLKYLFIFLPLFIFPLPFAK
ncbi:hypothetical protein QJ130_02680 [Metamycoplasma hyosynoviae]|uniref:Uncharacterized protein n=1 Tax=Metamycoplasma hyosynoviae TaxID=29559 RepID=A0AAP4EMA6_9BACT|nr:hypothetical protein [Metamycoplasma hyosynoviae]MDI3048173.1 hypothetical protein [Metamycoplasma hyosynoviae]MDI3102896.1 hypothetical protein [Metamycoplasma hyosynoviae]MDI3118253.1 hypothetical protein [Metamycoplasma hyosynoviae]